MGQYARRPFWVPLAWSHVRSGAPARSVVVLGKTDAIACAHLMPKSELDREIGKRRRAPILVVLGMNVALGQMTTSALATSHATTPAAEQSSAPAWSFSASAYAYFPRDSQDYVQPTLRADRNWLHLEARYNYESLNTGSTWVGYTFNSGEKVKLDFTSMLGAVYGKTNGYAPGYEFTLSWGTLQLYSEGEYVFDTRNSSDSYFYTWSELTLSPVEWFEFGPVIQRTKVYQSNFNIQRGVLVRFSRQKLDLSACVFNPDADWPTYVLALSISF